MSIFTKAMMNQTNATHLTTIPQDGSSVEEYLTTLAEAEDTGKAIFWFKILPLQLSSFENQQSPVYLVNLHF